MTTPPPHLQPERLHRRLLSIAVAVAVVAAFGWYLTWRIGSTLDGAFVPLAFALLSIEVVLGVRITAPALLAAFTPIGAQVEAPDGVVECDLVVVVDDASLAEVRRTVASCTEVRGRVGLLVADAGRRPEIAELCRARGVPVVDPTEHRQLGTEPDRRAPYLLLVPAGQLVSPDICVVLAPAFTDGVGVVTGAVTVHAAVELIGSDGYPLGIDHDERLAARLDHLGAAPPTAGPALFDKAALREAGGARWRASDPILASHRRVSSAGWRSRFVHPPVAYRMAPASEAEALAQRHRRVRDWADADSTIDQRGWSRLPALVLRLEQAAAVARLSSLAILTITATTGQLPLVVDDLLEAVTVVAVWLAAAALAGRSTDGHRWSGHRPPFEPTRVGLRTVAADLTAVRGAAPATIARAQLAVLASSLVVAALTCWFALIRPTDASATTRIVLALCAFGVASAVRDAAGGFRQLRQLPRAEFTSRGRHDLVDLSPLGYAIESGDPPGTLRRLELDLPLPDRRVRRITVDGRVTRSTKRGDAAIAHVRIAPDPATYDDLYYFCAVTAPTIRWMGGSPRVEVDGGYRRLNMSASAPTITTRSLTARRRPREELPAARR